MLMLKKVIAFARCSLRLSDVKNTVELMAKEVFIIQARGGFSNLEIVKDLRGL